MNPKTKNIRLCVKRVFISDDFDGELFPRYSRMLFGKIGRLLFQQNAPLIVFVPS
uniref:Uncharacterized protein n=1 Tax=Arundo donax TaxID=35708 RepID=A0A0A9T519_ARUDO